MPFILEDYIYKNSIKRIIGIRFVEFILACIAYHVTPPIGTKYATLGMGSPINGVMD